MQERGKFLEIKPYGVKIGQIYGLGVVMDPYSGEMTGNVLIVKGFVEGPSAGVTMAILLCSLIEGKPIRQDVAVTGEINIGLDDTIQVTAVGGVHEKIKAAEMWGIQKSSYSSQKLPIFNRPKRL